MSDKLPICQASGKTCFSSAKTAKRARGGLGNKLRAYFCPDCKSFHVTNGER